LIPAQFRVIVTRRPKLACRSCAGIAASGRTALETDPQGLAAGEVRGVIAEILEMLDG